MGFGFESHEFCGESSLREIVWKKVGVSENYRLEIRQHNTAWQ